jgi:hypothetical protein
MPPTRIDSRSLGGAAVALTSAPDERNDEELSLTAALAPSVALLSRLRRVNESERRATFIRPTTPESGAMAWLARRSRVVV